MQFCQKCYLSDGAEMRDEDAMTTRLVRLHIYLSAKEVAAIDDYRFAKRMPNRAAAIRELLKRGIAAS